MLKKISVFALITLLFAISAFAAPDVVGVENAEEITQEAAKEETASLAATYTEGYFTYSVSNGKATITGCDTSISGDVVIPATIGGYPVTSIGSYAFEDCRSLKSVTFGENSQLTSIGYYAFRYCTSLESVYITDLASWCNIKFTDSYSSPLYNGADLYINNALAEEITIPEGITSINSYILRGCTSVKSIKIPSGVTSIGELAFTGCTSLASIEIPDSVTSIGSSAFRGCSSLASIEIPSSVTSIGEHAFYNCTSLASVTFGENSQLTSIGYYAFYYCTSLTSIEIPSAVTSIGTCAFENCTSLASVIFGENSQLTSIGYYAFRYCTSLTSIEIPSGVTSIGSDAFYKCTSLTSIELPSGVTSIGYSAFGSCTSLVSIDIPDSVTSIGSDAFYYCSKLKAAYYAGTLEQWNSISIGSGNSYLTNVVVTDNKFKIIYNANNGEAAPEVQYQTRGEATNLSLEIPNREGYEFLGWSTAKDGEVEYAPGAEYLGKENIELFAVWTCNAQGKCGFNIKWQIKDNVLSITGTGSMTNWTEYSSVPWYKYRSEIRKVVIESGIKSVSDYAFYKCDNLKEVVLPESITSIGYESFYYCTGLESITFAENSELTSIGSYVFYNCTSLENIEIPNSVISIGSSAFYNCTSIESIAIPDNVTSIGAGAFSYCKNLVEVRIGSGVESIDSSVFNECYKLEKITVSDNNGHYSSDKYGVLFDKNQTTLIQYPIGKQASAYTVPDAVKTIGNRAFAYCAALAKINLGISTERVRSWAFYDCENLETVYLPESVTKIDSNAFGGDVSVKNVYYEGTLEQLESIQIGDYNDGFLNADFTFSHVPTYAVVYNANGGTLKVSQQNKKPGEPLVLTESVPTRIGHAFLGWSVEQNGEVVYNPGDEYTENADIVLYAVWEEVMGDASGDGKITNEDITIVADAIFGKTLTEEEFKYANVYDEDNEINVKDLIKLAQMMTQNK